jgi:hypothetical protein
MPFEAGEEDGATDAAGALVPTGELGDGAGFAVARIGVQ